MEKKYQVFISSTYNDLLEERSEVMQALLELDCIPVGMELFPAADDDQWTLIKRLIDDCDYYVLIVAGRYGTIHPNQGTSYTQMEYEYAVKQNIPVIAFLHKNPDNIASGKTDNNIESKGKLDIFKARVSEKLCKYWETPAELGGVVSRSLVKLIKEKPRAGWVKSTYVPDEDTNKTMLDLRKQIDNLEEELKKRNIKLETDDEMLAQGDDVFFLSGTAKRWNMQSSTKDEPFKVATTWNDFFSILSPLMVHEISEYDIRATIKKYVIKTLYPGFTETMYLQGVEIEINEDVFQTIKIQLRALDLIAPSNKKRSVKDTDTYWTLTDKGDNLMVQLRAIGRNLVSAVELGDIEANS
jgi:hypothetical protein